MPPHTQLSALEDSYGRLISYLRLSITDRCDFRCTYCMSEDVEFLPRDAVMSLEECLRIARIFTEMGVKKIRVTGGEPLVRKNALWLFEALGKLPGLQELVLTTNGSQLARYAPALRNAGVSRVNISLDTLQPERFRQITRSGSLSDVLDGLTAALGAGFERVKLNTVMVKGLNDDEFVTLLNFAREQGTDISFIEEMPFGERSKHGSTPEFVRTEDALAHLSEHFSLTPTQETSGGPARYWRLPDSPIRVGFISPHNSHFCESCNRVRMACNGTLYPCLGQNQARDLLPLLRAHPHDDAPLRAAIEAAIQTKPEHHSFNDAPSGQIIMLRPMSLTGG